MIGAKSTVAKYCAELKTALAVPRSAVGNHAATIRLFAGKEGDSATPSRKRSVNSINTAPVTVIGSKKGSWIVNWCPWPKTQPCSNVNTDQSVMLQP